MHSGSGEIYIDCCIRLEIAGNSPKSQRRDVARHKRKDHGDTRVETALNRDCAGTIETFGRSRLLYAFCGFYESVREDLVLKCLPCSRSCEDTWRAPWKQRLWPAYTWGLVTFQGFNTLRTFQWQVVRTPRGQYKRLLLLRSPPLNSINSLGLSMFQYVFALCNRSRICSFRDGMGSSRFAESEASTVCQDRRESLGLTVSRCK